MGRHPVLDALESGRPIDRVALQQGITGEFEKAIRHLTKEKQIPLQVVPRERLNALVRGNHQGVVAWLGLLEYQSLENLLPFVFEKGETPLILLLDGITDVRNLGAIARSAEICGAQALVLPRSGSAPINEEAMKTSAGALTRLPVCRESSLMAAVDLLQNSGVRVLASRMENALPVYEMDLRTPVAILLGSEDRGVQPSLMRAADGHFRIPQVGETESFNVSVAAGIILYEALRQRLTVSG